VDSRTDHLPRDRPAKHPFYVRGIGIHGRARESPVHPYLAHRAKGRRAEGRDWCAAVEAPQFAQRSLHVSTGTGLRTVRAAVVSLGVLDIGRDDFHDRHLVLGDWKPPAEMLQLPDNAPVFKALGDRHRGLVVTSYSRLKMLRGGYRAPLVEPADILEPLLPGGSATGIFLHDVLENVDFRVLRLDASLEAWRTRGDVKALFRRAMRRNGIEPRFLGEAERIVHTALTSPVTLGPHHLGGGFASIEIEMREVAFVYPYPEADGKLRRGYAKGFVDFVFEVAGMTYFCDWKSDVLPTWDEDALNEHVRRNYTLQAKLYTLALIKMLGIANEKDYAARFGGLVYCFVRGMPSGGIYFEQPSWTTVSTWTDELVREERL